MLYKKMISEAVLEVMDTEVTFGGVKRQYRYYDIVNWTDLSNKRLTRQTNPSKVKFKLSEEWVAWIKSFHLASLELEKCSSVE